jgi:hypothetical protein
MKATDPMVPTAHSGGPDAMIHPLQVRAWQRLGASGRSELATQLRRQVRRWKLDALRAQHPDWTDDRLRRELARLYLRGSS